MEEYENAAVGGAFILLLCIMAVLKPHLDRFWDEVDERIEKMFGGGGDAGRKKRA